MCMQMDLKNGLMAILFRPIDYSVARTGVVRRNPSGTTRCRAVGNSTPITTGDGIVI